MPDGRVHTLTTMALSGALAYASYRAGYPLTTTAALAGGALSGLLLSPDLDVDRGSISMAHVQRISGCLIGMLWSILWKPYALIIHHRSPLSHFPILGTVIRLAYVALIGLLIMSVLRFTGINNLPVLPAWWPWSVAGLALADLLHFILDQTLRN